MRDNAIPPAHLPILDLEGGPEEQGAEHGRILRAQIARNVAIYERRFAVEAGLDAAVVRRRATAYMDSIAARSPSFAAGLRGLAAGSGEDLERIVALNVRYEILYDGFAHPPGGGGSTAGGNAGGNAGGRSSGDTVGGRTSGGCTAVAVPPARSRDGRLILGQNWDWIPDVAGAVLRTREPDGTTTLSYTEAGILGGKIGMNSHGIALAINGLISVDDDWSRLGPPFHQRCWEILRSKNLDEASRAALATPRSCSANYMIAFLPARIVNIETAPNAERAREAGKEFAVHANHFVQPEEIGVVEPADLERLGSCRRQVRMERLLTERGRIGLDNVELFLRDHGGGVPPASVPPAAIVARTAAQRSISRVIPVAGDAICRHPDPAAPKDERYATVASIVMDPAAGRMRIAAGPPCMNIYRDVMMGDREADPPPPPSPRR
jgi:isopenicillin-N N-acyltransferase like protein